ncbi:unnamed protein product [Rotaria magnacalcarata]|uniref:Uncharacterized protein n=1 Tax=Rotaria magnacalcarata TaxID=392030 RepID=A0A8S2KPK6_9BILA|nr:unnamed protein product [Rotaria magnacalcarata]
MVKCSNLSILQITKKKLTLTLNVDGVKLSKNSQTTIWPILLVVNEIPPNSRFKIENVIIAGVWPGPSKPSRGEIRLLLRPFIDELLYLESGYIFDFHDGTTDKVQVYLIGACCDKPAQAILQCISEPTAAFGCGRCEVSGFMVPTKNDGNVRSFSMDYDNTINVTKRSNKRYDELITIYQLQQQLKDLWPNKKKLPDVLIDEQREKGIVGVCLFRDLTYFDVGRSFMSDSLHNVYIGAFKRMLDLWLNKKYRKENWNIVKHLKKLAELFSSLRLPSTTTRRPRSLLDYHKFKGNELRVHLLFGHRIFYRVLQQRYYNHLLQLVVLMHLAEKRKIDNVDLKIIQQLSRSIVVSFPELYSDRHCVQVVHSVLHIGDTVDDFGPITNYTTFQFENDLGKFNGTCNFGRIRSIVTIDEAQRIIYVAQLQNVLPLICSLDESTKYEFSGIQIAPKVLSSFILIDVDDIIEKTVLFESPTLATCVYRFPNLIHSS